MDRDFFETKSARLMNRLGIKRIPEILAQVEQAAELIEQTQPILSAILYNTAYLLQGTTHLVEHQQCQGETLANVESLLRQEQEALRAVRNQQTDLRQLLEQQQKQLDFFDEHLRAILQQTHTLEALERRSLEALERRSLEEREWQLSEGIIFQPAGKDQVEPELELMAHLYSYLPSRNALDIGANVGDASEYLLQSGYTVYAFEPSKSTYNQLLNRLQQWPNFRAQSVALGSKDGVQPLYFCKDLSGEDKYADLTLYSTLKLHPTPVDLQFASKVDVSVRSLTSLHASGEVPKEVGLVKIDTEGNDFEVILGMNSHRYPVVILEYWDREHVFGGADESSVSYLVKQMRMRQYPWHVVIYRTADNRISFYPNRTQSPGGTWGNIFFFQDYDVFCQALRWCSTSLPATHFR